LCFGIGTLASKIERPKFPYRMYEMPSVDPSQSGVKSGQDGAALNTALDHTSASATPKTNFVQLNRLVTPIRTGRSSLFPNQLRYHLEPDEAAVHGAARQDDAKLAFAAVAVPAEDVRGHLSGRTAPTNTTPSPLAPLQ
jgi:hypothetical protein